MEYGVGLIAAKVDGAVVGEETVHLPLTLVLGSKALSVYRHRLTEWILCVLSVVHPRYLLLY